jgi:hypothetical protein
MDTAIQLELPIGNDLVSPPPTPLPRLIRVISDFFCSPSASRLIRCGCCRRCAQFVDNYVTFSFDHDLAYVTQIWVCPRCGRVRDITYRIQTYSQ